MNKFFYFLILVYRKIKTFVLTPVWKITTVISFRAFGVEHFDFQTYGVPYIRVKNGKMSVGKAFKINNDYAGNIIGRQQKCIFVVRNGILVIGENVGMSSTAIVCHKKIEIGNNVRIGGNTVIYDTDFHSLNCNERINIPEIKKNIQTKQISIGNNVFIGGHSTILKGTTIGDNSIIGAGSVVTGYIPQNEIWAGNPVKFIQKIND